MTDWNKILLDTNWLSLRTQSCPATDPCGTPLSTTEQSDACSPKKHIRLLLLRKTEIHRFNLPVIPYPSSLQWDSLSTAFAKARNKMFRSSFLELTFELKSKVSNKFVLKTMLLWCQKLVLFEMLHCIRLYYKLNHFAKY